MKIRPFEERDRDDVAALWQRVFPGDPPRNAPDLVIARKRHVQPELFLVGELSGRVIATAIGGYDGFRGWVYHVAVDPEQQRRQHGRAMMSAIEARLVDLGCPKLNLQVRNTNLGVVEFYRSLGFEVEEQVSMGKLLPGASREGGSSNASEAGEK